MSRTQLWALTGLTTAAVAGALTLAAPAHAAVGGTVRVVGTSVEFSAAAGAANAVQVNRSGNSITVHDQHAITSGAGCTAVNPSATQVRCVLSAAPASVTIQLGDGADTLVGSVDVPMFVNGGAGSDTITTGTAGDSVHVETASTSSTPGSVPTPSSAARTVTPSTVGSAPT